MPDENGQKLNVVTLDRIYDKKTMLKTLGNLSEVLAGPDEPGIWDNIAKSLGPVSSLTPQGDPLQGLVDGHGGALPLSEIYKTLDVSAVVTSVVAPIARGIESFLFNRTWTPTEYLAARRKEELENLEYNVKRRANEKAEFELFADLYLPKSPKRAKVYKFEPVYDAQGNITGYERKPVHEIEGEHPDAFPLIL